MEKACLSLLAGKPELAGLDRYAKSIDQRICFGVSREIATFFYAETIDGYYASEHEIIWMHLLLSWGYSLEHKFESACVEAREAAHLISSAWSHGGQFDDAMLRIAVEDTGRGLTTEQKEKIFKPFERAGAENTSTEGTGLGLVIVQQLVVMMGGEIGVESEAGKGSCFWLLVPRG